jgi:hypothetical protein
MALVVSGMNDVLNSQSYTQAAWWNRIPGAAWLLMVAIAVCSNVLLGYRAHSFRQEAVVLLVMPLVASISFFLIADIDSPRGGLIRVTPQNLAALAESLRARDGRKRARGLRAAGADRRRGADASMSCRCRGECLRAVHYLLRSNGGLKCCQKLRLKRGWFNSSWPRPAANVRTIQRIETIRPASKRSSPSLRFRDRFSTLNPGRQ